MVLVTLAAIQHLYGFILVSRPMRLDLFTYAKDLQHIAIGIITGKFITGTVKTKHELLWVLRKADVMRMRLRHDNLRGHN